MSVPVEIELGGSTRPVPGPEASQKPRRVLVVLNPAAGGARVDEVHAAIEQHRGAAEVEIYETKPDDDVADRARRAIADGVDLVVAAGGDGTVGAVANALVGSEVPLAIIPLGTANVLARALGVPVEVDAACALAVGEHAVRSIDAMRVGERYYFTQVGVGLDALMIRDTTREQKRRFGRVAYLWTAFTRLLGFQPRRFSIRVDAGEARPRRASQVVVANVGAMGEPWLQWGPDIRIDDGVIDLCVVNARTLIDYANVSWYMIRGKHRGSSHVRYQPARELIRLETDRPMPVQADGEIIGDTPVTVEVVPGALRVAVPPTPVWSHATGPPA